MLAPAEWRPGDDLLKAPAQTLDEVLASPNATDWFYCPIKDGAEPWAG